jgi:glycosyltransferase involved in cell wall biosynthesis
MDDAPIPSHLPEHQRLREPTRYAATVVKTILEQWFPFDSVLDLGCGTGNWLSCFASGGKRDVLGLEMEDTTPDDLEIDADRILRLDLGLPVDLRRRFDLALCLEVAEHLPAEQAATLVENCVRHADVVLFSAALPGQRGLHHVNEQPPEYWATLFARHDYAVVDALRPRLWNDSRIPIWYRQNMLLFVRHASPLFSVIQEQINKSPAPPPLARAHPEYLAYFSDVAKQAEESERALTVRATQLSDEVQQLRQQLNRSVVRLAIRSAMRVARAGARVIPISYRIKLRYALGKRGLLPPMPLPKGPVVTNPTPPPGTPVRRRGDGDSPRIVFISGEATTPGHQYRVVRYTRIAESLGASAWWMDLEDWETHRDVLRRANIVILWRTRKSAATDEVIRIARAASATVLFDVDDLVFLPELATEKVIDGIRSQKFSASATREAFLQFRQVMEQADACLCTTRELADQIRRLSLVAYVTPNGFDLDTFSTARVAMRRWRAMRTDTLIRLGYAGGSRTHQRDFGMAAEAVAKVLSEHPAARLVLFRVPGSGQTLLDINEYPCFTPVLNQIEWRDMVPLTELPHEMARFDINLAPLETGNIFCDAKSELKYFEAALAGVCTVASPTGPMARVIREGETGMLADTAEQWYDALSRLIAEPDTRHRIARAAFADSVVRFGPDQQRLAFRAVLDEVRGGPDSALSMQSRIMVMDRPAPSPPDIPEHDTLFASDALRAAEVTVIVPLYNYRDHVLEALASVRHQTLRELDLIVVDDASTDGSAELVLDWMKENTIRFNRLFLLRNKENSGLARTRNAGFDAAETAFVLPLDADNRLRPECCAACLSSLRDSAAGYAYPMIETFGASTDLMGTYDFRPSRFIAGNYIDAMALVSKSAWLRAGGYAPIQHGWEDYDFWCRCLEQGIGGVQVPSVLADYRVHQASMLHTQTDLPGNKAALIADLEARHPWLRIARSPG